MATLTIRQLDEAVIQRLKERAAAQGHSMEQEAREILTREAGAEREAALARLRAHREELWRKHGVFPDSTGIIRQMRDERTGWLERRSSDEDVG